MRVILSIVGILFLVGCSATGILYTEKNNASVALDGKSRIYVYRINQLKGSGAATPLLDNGQLVGSINVGGYISYLTEPGSHELLTKTLGIDKLFTVNIDAGKTYYFRIDYNPGTWTGTFTVNAMLENVALPEIQLTHYQGE